MVGPPPPLSDRFESNFLRALRQERVRGVGGTKCGNSLVGQADLEEVTAGLINAFPLLRKAPFLVDSPQPRSHVVRSTHKNRCGRGQKREESGGGRV